MSAALRDALARALASAEYEAVQIDFDAFLAALRQDPEVLQAVAEALHDETPPEQDGGVPNVCNRWDEHEAAAARLLDRLLGSTQP